MNSLKLWKYVRYLMFAIMTVSVSVSAVSCVQTALVGPAEPVDDDGNGEPPVDTED